jgi:hypothetical protein
MPNNDSGISRGFTVSHRVKRQIEHRELTAMSWIDYVAGRSGSVRSSCFLADVSALADSLGRRATDRSASLLQRSH